MEKRSVDKAKVVVTPTKKSRTPLRTAKKEKEPGTEHDAEEQQAKTLVVTLPADALECPLCLAPFEAAVFQCTDGHAACGGCCERVQGVCPTCREPIGGIRCRPLEIAVAGMLVPCGFRSAGCKEMVPFAAKRAHEAFYCHHAPCACPVPACAYSGSGVLLHDHILDAHRDAAGAGAAVEFVRETTVTLLRSMAFRVLLHAPDARVFLLLSGGDVPAGRSLALLSVGPLPAPDRALEYTMLVRAGVAGEPGPGGALSLLASGPVPCTRRWAGPGHHLPTEGFLFVPDAYWSSSGCLSVTVHVKKLVVPPAPPVIDRP